MGVQWGSQRCASHKRRCTNMAMPSSASLAPSGSLLQPLATYRHTGSGLYAHGRWQTSTAVCQIAVMMKHACTSRMAHEQAFRNPCQGIQPVIILQNATSSEPCRLITLTCRALGSFEHDGHEQMVATPPQQPILRTALLLQCSGSLRITAPWEE